MLADIQRLYENEKWILRFFNGIYILFKRRFLAAPHRFVKLFHLQQWLGILDSLWWTNSTKA